MNGIGNKLRQAREAKGYTISQLAEKTRILNKVVADLEVEDYSHIPAPIYGRGFVKLYAEAVGLDPMECVNEFMESLNSASKTGPAPAAVRPASAPAAAPASPAAATTTTAESLFEQPSPEQPAEAAPAFTAPAAMTERDSRLSRYATPLRDSPTLGERLALIPTPVWRLALLALATLALLALVGFGIRALYRATTTAPAREPAATTNAPATAAPAKVQAKARQVSLPPEIYFN